MHSIKLSRLFVFLFAFHCLAPVCFAERIVVVGAGLAGLTAAYDLQREIRRDPILSKKDLEVVVIEAKDRPGGRVFTVTLNGQPAELGGENILDGGEAPTLRRLVRELHLRIKTFPRISQESLYFDAKLSTQFNVKKDLAPFFPHLRQKELTAQLESAERSAKSLIDVIDAFFAHHPSDDPKTRERRDVLKRYLLSSVKSYEGAEAKDLSPRYAHGSLSWMMSSLLPPTKAKKRLEDPSDEAASESIEGGNSKLVLALADKMGTQLRLSTPLRTVQAVQATNGVGYELEVGSGGATEKIQSDYLILALPAGVYKHVKFGTNTIEPERLSQISKIAYGTHAKILFPHANEEAKRRGFGSNGLVIWSRKDVPWSTFYYDTSLGLISGPEQYKSRQEYAFSIMGSYASQFHPLEVAQPTKIFDTYSTPVSISWGLDPYIGGSYSYYSPESRAALETVALVDGHKVLPLFSPVKGRIYFAGEHTTVDQDIRGTMEAAAESGARAAKMLVKRLKADLK